MPDNGALVRKWNQMTSLGPPSLNIWDPYPPFSLFFSLVRDGRTIKREAMQKPLGRGCFCCKCLGSCAKMKIYSCNYSVMPSLTSICFPLPDSYGGCMYYFRWITSDGNGKLGQYDPVVGRGVMARGGSHAHRCFLFFFFFFLVLPVYCYQPISHHPHAHMLSHVIPWTSARQTPLSMDFSRQEYWSGLPFPSPTQMVSKGGIIR